MKNLLIIDDDTYVYNQLKKHMEGRGFYIAVALTANEGLKRIQSHSVDFVLCDYRLPDADGAELFERIKRISSNLPIVFMTAHSDVRKAVRMIRTGISNAK